MVHTLLCSLKIVQTPNFTYWTSNLVEMEGIFNVKPIYKHNVFNVMGYGLFFLTLTFFLWH